MSYYGGNGGGYRIDEPYDGPDYVFKVVMTGDSNVGKSSMVSKYSKNIFPHDPKSTVGVQYEEITITSRGKKVKIQLWDTAGQEKFRSLIRSYYRSSQAIILMYDVTERKSFENLSAWLNDMTEQAADGVIVFLIGNKIDLLEEYKEEKEEEEEEEEDGNADFKFKKRKVSRLEALEFARNNHLYFIETSAKTGDNVSILFENLASDLVKSHSTTGGKDGNPDIIDHNTVKSYKRKLRSSSSSLKRRSDRAISGAESTDMTEEKEEEESEDRTTSTHAIHTLSNTYERKDSRTDLKTRPCDLTTSSKKSSFNVTTLSDVELNDKNNGDNDEGCNGC